MKFIPFIFLIFFSTVICTGQEDSNFPKGYIQTKNNYHLTGSIGSVDHTTDGSMVLFVNDFGTPYYLHPALIKGFVYFEGPAIVAYESKQWESKWLFLSVQYSGSNVRLLQTPETLLHFTISNGQLTTTETSISEYWLELPGRGILPIKKFGFRFQMKKLIRDISPSLAAKIGKPGYRFKNLYTILDMYDKEYSKGKTRL